MKFNLGDPVWARSYGENVPSKEYAAVILKVVTDEMLAAEGLLRRKHPGHQVYGILCEALPVPAGEYWAVCGCRLRPRRDDYQQREALGSMDKISEPPALTEDSLEEMCELISTLKK